MHLASAHAPTKRSLLKIALCAVALVLLATLPAGSGIASPRIERFPAYRPQTTCSPKPKPGTVKLANYLMKRYRGSGSLGISRSCGSSGVSEHKEGRAFDWALNVNSRRDRRYAANFLHRIRKADRQGHRAALARRMGIMYVIWNDRIYSATHHYRKQRYKNSGCRRIKGCSASLRHRNHMHISLTRAAARGRTSWYQRHGAGRGVHKVKAPAKPRVQGKLRHKRLHRKHAVHHRRHRGAHRAEHRRHQAAHDRQHRADRAAHLSHHRQHKAAHRRYHHRHHSARDHRRYHRSAARDHKRDHRVAERRHKRDHRKAARHHRRDHRAARRHHARDHQVRHYHRASVHRRNRRGRRSARMIAPQTAPQVDPTLQYDGQLADLDALTRDWRNVADPSEDALDEAEAH